MFPEIEFISSQPNWAQAIFGFFVLFILASAAYIVANIVFLKGFSYIEKNLPEGISRIFLHGDSRKALVKISPAIVIHVMISAVPKIDPAVVIIVKNVAMAVIVLYSVKYILGLLDGFHVAYREKRKASPIPTASIKSYIQLSKLLSIVIGAIFIISTLIDRSPLILLSGLGAMSAVLMIVFKDTLLSFTAGVQISSNDILRIGDWIEMPQMGADGDVVDIALHQVRVQNWDKTITSIPTWKFMSESFKNWRGMREFGGRRIKRTLKIDTSSVRFLDDQDIERFMQISLLRPYLEGKIQDVSNTNQALGEQACIPTNKRRLTNMGTFRAYVNAYLQNHHGINPDMILMVRAMEPTPEGVGLELYCFTKTVAWVEYETVQSDIFDHLIAIMPEFDLKLYQKPSGKDLLALKVQSCF